jgi:hypothetical protein
LTCLKQVDSTGPGITSAQSVEDMDFERMNSSLHQWFLKRFVGDSRPSYGAGLSGHQAPMA